MIVPALVIVGATLAIIPTYADILSPLEQHRSGVPMQDILCADGKTLMESTRGTPACVSAGNAERLVQRGWGTVVEVQKDAAPPDAEAQVDGAEDSEPALPDVTESPDTDMQEDREDPKDAEPAAPKVVGIRFPDSMEHTEIAMQLMANATYDELVLPAKSDGRDIATYKTKKGNTFEVTKTDRGDARSINYFVREPYIEERMFEYIKTFMDRAGFYSDKDIKVSIGISSIEGHTGTPRDRIIFMSSNTWCEYRRGESEGHHMCDNYGNFMLIKFNGWVNSSNVRTSGGGLISMASVEPISGIEGIRFPFSAEETEDAIQRLLRGTDDQLITPAMDAIPQRSRVPHTGTYDIPVQYADGYYDTKNGNILEVMHESGKSKSSWIAYYIFEDIPLEELEQYLISFMKRAGFEDVSRAVVHEDGGTIQGGFGNWLDVEYRHKWCWDNYEEICKHMGKFIRIEFKEWIDNGELLTASTISTYKAKKIAHEFTREHTDLYNSERCEIRPFEREPIELQGHMRLSGNMPLFSIWTGHCYSIALPGSPPDVVTVTVDGRTGDIAYFPRLYDLDEYWHERIDIPDHAKLRPRLDH